MKTKLTSSTPLATQEGSRAWPAPAKPGSSVWKAWNDHAFEDRHKGDPDSFRMGWEAAMRSIWDRPPAPEYAMDPMTPREVAKLLDYVWTNLPNTP